MTWKSFFKFFHIMNSQFFLTVEKGSMKKEEEDERRGEDKRGDGEMGEKAKRGD